MSESAEAQIRERRWPCPTCGTPVTSWRQGRVEAHARPGDDPVQGRCPGGAVREADRLHVQLERERAETWLREAEHALVACRSRYEQAVAALTALDAAAEPEPERPPTAPLARCSR